MPPINENYVAQVNKLENISAQEAVTFLQPMISKDGYISAFGPGNLLLIVDSSLNIRKLQGLLHLIDTEKTREGIEIIYLKYASAESVVSFMLEVKPLKTQPGRNFPAAIQTCVSFLLRNNFFIGNRRQDEFAEMPNTA